MTPSGEMAEVYFKFTSKTGAIGTLIIPFPVTSMSSRGFLHISYQLFCLQFCVPANADLHGDPGSLNADFPCCGQEGRQQ